MLKDSRKFLLHYIKEFGDLIEKEFALKIECIKLKKIITYCQARQNRDEPVYQSELDTYIESIMKDYYDELQALVVMRNSPMHPIAEIDYYKIKRLYRKLVAMLHPDLHPALFEHEEIADLWGRVCAAYESNNYEELQALEIIVIETIKQYEECKRKINVENVDAKITLIKIEINKIIHNDPYRYRELLRDDDAVTEKKAELQKSIDEYAEYLSELQAEVDKFTVEDCG